MTDGARIPDDRAGTPQVPVDGPDAVAVPGQAVPTQEVVVLTGLSGGGKTAAAKLFEDLGYVVVDNLPGELLRDLADLVVTDPLRFVRTAIVLDVRAGDVPLAFGAMRGALEGRGIRPVIMFLEASDDVLIRRFSETRHRHPLADERGIAASIELERALLDPVRAQADVVVDTSNLSLRELRERLFARLGDVQHSDQLSIQLISFGFKYGVPLEADLVLDVRFMKNPHYIEALRPQNGMTEAVRDYVLAQPVAGAFLGHLEGLLDLLVPAYIDEGKTRLTIAIGCTGGFHRSIVMAEEVAAWLRERDFGPVAVFHRELER
jgi:RNase adapter protein RapZ